MARRLEPAGSHDACFLPRSSVCTGDIQIHEMAWGSRERQRLDTFGIPLSLTLGAVSLFSFAEEVFDRTDDRVLVADLWRD